MEGLDYKTIGMKIQVRRQAQGLTQEAVSNYLDVNPSHISNVENGRSHPSLTSLIKIANLLECSVDYFINHEYTYDIDKGNEKTLDDKIMDKLKYCDDNKKNRILQIIDII